MFTTVFVLCFLLGCVAGLRSLTAPAAVCWGARLGWLHLSGTKLGFTGSILTVVIVTLLAVFELVNDKLPKTPARTAPPGLIARILMGGFCGAALALSSGASLSVAVVIGIIGALVGTFGGYNVRHALVTRAHLPDLPVALIEDAIAVAGSLLIVSHL
jgi:uncharacterized membrane protein